MKTKKISLTLELPASDRELLRNLEDLAADPELAAATRGLADATANVEAAKLQLQQLDAEARRLPVAIARGRAGSSELDAALMAVRRAAALVPPAEAQLARAEAERTRATQAAKDRALALVNERFARLLKADEVLVAQLNALDSMMDALTFQLYRLCVDPMIGYAPAPFDMRGRTGEMPDRCRTIVHQAVSQQR